jgi:uncharacterized protein (DUF2236 family)
VARLHGTVRAMLALTFGTDAQARAAAAGINRIHDRVHGTLAEPVGSHAAGTPYSAHDPALLAWVQVTLLDSMPLAYERLVAPLTAGEKDAYCLEAREAASLLGVAPGTLPSSHAAVQTSIERAVADGTLAVGDEARSLASDLLAPRVGPVPWPGSRLVRLLTVGLLPSALRDAYGFEWSERDAGELERWTARARRASVRAPVWLRRWRAARRG